MKNLKEKALLGKLGVMYSYGIAHMQKMGVSKKKRNEFKQAHNRIVELIKIFFAKEISSGPIKEDISRPVLIAWLQGINQAATAVEDHYVMKATTQLITMLQNMNLPEYLRGIASKQCEVDGLKEHIKNIEKRCAELIQESVGKNWLPTAGNINALPEPLRKFIYDLETNADPPSMVADNIIMKDTIKTLEKMLEERPAVDEEFIAKWWRIFKDYQSGKMAGQLKNLIKTMLEEAGVEVVEK